MKSEEIWYNHHKESIVKKIFCAACILLFASLCFALPNIKLYILTEFFAQILDDAMCDEDGEILCEIRDGKLYEENNDYAGTITELDDRLVFTIIESDTIDEQKLQFEFSKTTGFLLLVHIWDGYENEEYIVDFDEKTGFEKKRSYYVDGQLDFYEVYEYEKGKLAKILEYNADGSLEESSQISYDKKTGNIIKYSDFDADNRLVRTTEYDPATKNQTKKSEYNADGSLKTQTIYDKNSGDAVERLVYAPASKKPVKWTYLQFDDAGKYALDGGFYLSTTLCRYSNLPEYAEKSKDAPIDWNENYSAVVRKFDFNKSTVGYSYIENLKKRNYLSERSFTLCGKNSDFYYCFTTNDDDEIDISSSYEIRLTKKAKDYPAMNKSGRGNGPFGFDIGMTYEEVKAACGGSEPEHIADNRYYVKPKKAHPLFEKYIVWISDAVGLYYIKGISRDISVSDYGTEARRQFDNLLSPLEKKYGKFTLTDTVKPDYYRKDDKYWMQALRDGARTYRADWAVNRENRDDFDGLYGIIIGIDSADKYSTSKAYIWIEYEFLNYDAAQEALNDVL